MGGRTVRRSVACSTLTGNASGLFDLLKGLTIAGGVVDLVVNLQHHKSNITRCQHQATVPAFYYDVDLRMQALPCFVYQITLSGILFPRLDCLRTTRREHTSAEPLTDEVKEAALVPYLTTVPLFVGSLGVS